ncbi:hypothetical protein [Curtobacterium sp. MCSS17_015]|uniref:hypothetical protein n=1 Tax=Curtobacterium sp. MCSS17_015 TaxID=2175666 RepID=UPI000DA927C8|nr:hypothetical protein [Curtobacterium sp. MCSS17_015]WIB25407.1 hypothetical protein DEJ18_10090 [Curtobacterium sp. MCSS17_015]
MTNLTHHLAVSGTLSAAAREALNDHLSAPCAVFDILEQDSGTWTPEDAEAAARELERHGYGTVHDGHFLFAIALREPPQLPTDHLDELVPALALVDRVFDEVMQQRTEATPNPTNALGVSFPILMQLQNVLRLAVYGQQGKLTHADMVAQLPDVATMLARAIRAEVS